MNVIEDSLFGYYLNQAQNLTDGYLGNLRA